MDVTLELMHSLAKELSDLRRDVKVSRKFVYSNQELADMMEVSTQTLKKWRDRGYLPYTQCGSVYLYSESDVRFFLENNHHDAYAV